MENCGGKWSGVVLDMGRIWENKGKWNIVKEFQLNNFRYWIKGGMKSRMESRTRG